MVDLDLDLILMFDLGYEDVKKLMGDLRQGLERKRAKTNVYL